MLVMAAFLAPAAAQVKSFLPDDLGNTAPAPAAGFGDSRDHVKVSVKAGLDQVAVGGEVPIAVVFDHDKKWHIHTNNPNVPPELGDVFVIKTELKVKVEPQGAATAHVGHIQWPKVHMEKVGFGAAPVQYGVFSGRAIAFVPVTIAPDAEPGEVTLKITATYQACDESTCLPPVDEEFEVKVQVVEPASVDTAAFANLSKGDFAEFDGSVWVKVQSGNRGVPEQPKDASKVEGSAKQPGAAVTGANRLEIHVFGATITLNTGSAGGLIALLLIAVLGGVALNFMPCVLPVIPIKILSLTKSAGTRRRSIALGGAMALGVLAFWLALGLLVAALTSFDGPSQIFSYPETNIAVGAFIIVMGLGLSGLFTPKLPNWVYNISPKHDSYSGSFAFGILTSLLATPCTGPLMGGALGWAVTQPPIVSLLVFGAIGVGMAVPYLILAAYPKLIDKLPRTGPGNELLKQVMALLMLAAGAFFLGVGLAIVLAPPGGPVSQMYWLPVMLLLAAAGFWLTWRIARIKGWPIGPIVFAVLGLLLLNAGLKGTFNTLFPDRGEAVAPANGNGGKATRGGTHIDWNIWSPDRFADWRKADEVLVVDFTAEWCLTCKWLEANVLHTTTVADALRQVNVRPVKVDLTVRPGNPGWQYLKEHGFTGPPLLLIYAPDGTVVFKSNAYTINDVIDAINRAKGPRVASASD